MFNLKINKKSFFLFVVIPILIFYLSFSFYSSIYKKLPIRYAILFSISSALLTATKLNGIMLYFIFNFLLLLSLIDDYFFKNKLFSFKIIFNFVLVFFLFFHIFILLDPTLINNPLKALIDFYLYRYNVSLSHAVDNPNYALFSIEERIKAIYNMAFSETRFSYGFSRFYFLSDIINNNNAKLYLRLCLIFFYLGLLTFITMNHKKKWFFLISFLLIILITISYLILNWDRYFIHLVFFFCFFLSHSLIIIPKAFNLVKSLIKKRR